MRKKTRVEGPQPRPNQTIQQYKYKKNPAETEHKQTETNQSERNGTKQMLERSGWVPKTPQLTGQSVIDEKCGGTKICVIAALPHILDSGKAGR